MKLHTIFGGTEYPLYNHHDLCPTARFVGGVSRYLCECKEPHKCHGIQATSRDIADTRKSLFAVLSI